MNTLPKNLLNRWSILFVIVIISLLGTYLISTRYVSNKPKDIAMDASKVSPTVAVASPSKLIDNSPVKVKLVSSAKEGFVDVFISNKSMLDHGEVVLKIAGSTRFNKIEDNVLFEKYLTTNETDKLTGDRVVKIGALKGLEGVSVSPADNQKFARVYFSSLTDSSVSLDTATSFFLSDSPNVKYQVVEDK